MGCSFYRGTDLRKFGLKPDNTLAQDYYTEKYGRNLKRNGLGYMLLGENIFYMCNYNLHRVTDDKSRLGPGIYKSSVWNHPLLRINSEMMDVLFGQSLSLLQRHNVNSESFLLFSKDMSREERYLAGAYASEVMNMFGLVSIELQKECEASMFSC